MKGSTDVGRHLVDGFQLPAIRPCVGVGTVGQRVAYGIISNGSTSVGNQLIIPYICVFHGQRVVNVQSIPVCGFLVGKSSQASLGVRVFLLARDVVGVVIRVRNCL